MAHNLKHFLISPVKEILLGEAIKAEVLHLHSARNHQSQLLISHSDYPYIENVKNQFFCGILSYLNSFSYGLENRNNETIKKILDILCCITYCRVCICIAKYSNKQR